MKKNEIQLTIDQRKELKKIQQNRDSQRKVN